MADSRPVLLAFLAGVLVGGVVMIGVQPPVNAGPDPESPPWSMSTAGPGCLEDRVHPDGGWMHETGASDHYAVTLDATVVHERGETVAANVSRVAPGVYVIDLRTVADADAAKPPDDDCPVATGVEIAASLPTDYREVRVTVDGRTLVTAEHDDTTADLYRLPNPVNATDA